jgi:RimJ/RimL family protein N-acetyltransferase
MPTQQELAEICHLDSQRGGAYVASIHREIVGLGYYVVEGREATAETAFLVEDNFQGRGIGRALFQLLARHALNHQVAAFNAYIQATNEPMIRIFRSAGFSLKERVSYGTREVHLALTARHN